MIIGKLRHRVTIKQLAAGQDAIGQPVQTWSNVVTDGDGSIAADIMHTSGIESIKSGSDASIVKASVRIRYRTGINAGMRAYYGSTVYEINAVIPDARKTRVDLVCQVLNATT